MKQDVISYLVGIPCWFLATAEEIARTHAQPHVRPFSFATLDADRICFCTATDKDVYRELIANPRFELSGWQAGKGWIVVSGSAVMDIDVSASTRAAGYRHMSGLGEVYNGADDPRLTFFTFEGGQATIKDIDGRTQPIDLSV